MRILGLSCHNHDAAAGLIEDGRILAAAQEERFNRRPHSPEFPIQSINACLQCANLTSLDLDAVTFYEQPYAKLERVMLDHVRAWPWSYRKFMDSMPDWLAHRLALPVDIRKKISFEGPISFLPHHVSLAAAAFFPSPFDTAAILTANGIGEWTTTAWGEGRGSTLSLRQQLHYPHSLGLLYTAVTAYLGFEANNGEENLTALSTFGEPSLLDRFKHIVLTRPDGSFAVDESYFGFVKGRQLYGPKFLRLFGPDRKPGEDLTQRHKDIAASLQRLTEEILIAAACHAHAQTGLNQLCVAGSIFQNATTNSRLLLNTPFKEVFIQPAADAAGGALGAALWTSHVQHKAPRQESLRSTCLGPSFTAAQLRRCLVNHNARFQEFDEPALARHTASLIASGKTVGWFQGRMEFGSHALGTRSILADPRNPTIKNRLNAEVKHREAFRSYGVSVLEEAAGQFFDLPAASSPFMLLTAPARPEMRNAIPSALHTDATSRIHTVTRNENKLYHDLIRAFSELTGVPMVINTSFSGPGEPLVCTPDEAWACFQSTKIDCLILGNYVTCRETCA